MSSTLLLPAERDVGDLIYLDFDGVLHPDAVYRHREAPYIRLRAPGHELFESCGVLERALLPYPDVSIVLSTSWVSEFSFDLARASLSRDLQRRDVGATFDSQLFDRYAYATLTRYEVVQHDVERRGPVRWLAVDNDDAGWPDTARRRLVRPPDQLGLACPKTQTDLARKLRATFGRGTPGGATGAR